MNNYMELTSRVDEDSLINDLPPTIKEEIFFYQFGNIINQLQFLQELDNDCVWGIVKHLKKIMYLNHDKIYNDDDLSETMYLIHKGKVKLFAENGYAFA